MVNFPGRNGRRRRVLNEEVLSASTSHMPLRAVGTGNVRNTPRYSDAAGIENHPQITDFVPRQYRTIALVVLIGLVTAAALGALDYFAALIADAFGMPTTDRLILHAPGSIASWVASVVWLLGTAICTLIYSLRRHRIDDYRGSYRIWLAAAAMCLLVSLNSVVGLHQVLSVVLTNASGWTALRDGAVWWLALGLLPMSWIYLRMLMDSRECRLAAALFIGAIVSYVTSATAFLGGLTTVAPAAETTVAGVGALLGHWLILAALVSYARFVVLDAQGLIVVVPRIKHPRKTQATSAARKASQRQQESSSSESVLSAGGYSRQRPAHDLQPAKPAAPDKWVDGSRPERDRYENDDEDESTDAGRKLSKADRKRLRKLKAQNRAA